MIKYWHMNLSPLMWAPASSVRGAVDATNKFTWTAEVLWRKGAAWPLSE